MKIELLGALAIPVGHRVTVRWYLKKSKGLFGGTSEERHRTQPQIEDLTTGVVYAYRWIYDHVGYLKDEDGNTSVEYPMQFSETLSEGVTEERAVTGTVRACRITMWTENDKGISPYTALTLEPEEGYR